MIADASLNGEQICAASFNRWLWVRSGELRLLRQSDSATQIVVSLRWSSRNKTRAASQHGRKKKCFTPTMTHSQNVTQARRRGRNYEVTFLAKAFNYWGFLMLKKRGGRKVELLSLQFKKTNTRLSSSLVNKTNNYIFFLKKNIIHSDFTAREFFYLAKPFLIDFLCV